MRKQERVRDDSPCVDDPSFLLSSYSKLEAQAVLRIGGGGGASSGGGARGAGGGDACEN